MRPVTVGLLAWTVAACAEAGEGDREAFVVRDSLGVRIVENGVPAWGPDEGWRLGGDPEWVIRDASFPEGGSLVDPEAVVLRPGGGVVVLDGVTREMAFFDGDGRFERSVGGEGDGPGEFRGVRDLQRLPGDTLAVLDQTETEYFDGSGRHLSAERRDLVALQEMVPRGTSIPRMLLPDGRILYFGSGFAPRPAHRAGAAHVDSIAWDVVSRDGSELRRLEYTPRFTRYAVTVDGREVWALPLFFAHPYVGRGPGRSELVTGHGAEPELRRFDGDERLESVVRWRHDPVEVDPDDRARARDETLAGISSPAEREAFARSLDEALELTTLPVFQDLHLDADGRVWVRSGQVVSRDPATFQVFSPEGRWLGAVEFPSGLENRRFEGGVLVIGRDRVVGVWRDELDVPEIRSYRLTR